MHCGNEEVAKEEYNVGPIYSKRAFRALLEVGVVRTNAGNIVVRALKGALDGGIDIPHSDKCFFCYNKEIESLDVDVN